MAAGLGHELVGFGAAFDGARFGPVGPDGEQVCGQGQEQIAVTALEFGRATTAGGKHAGPLSQRTIQRGRGELRHFFTLPENSKGVMACFFN